MTSALDDAIWTAKVVAGLDPMRAYPPAEWIDHLEPRWARQFWASQVDRVVDEALGAPRHNHFTRMVMAPGKCPRCDELAATRSPAASDERASMPVATSNARGFNPSYTIFDEAWHNVSGRDDLWGGCAQREEVLAEVERLKQELANMEEGE